MSEKNFTTIIIVYFLSVLVLGILIYPSFFNRNIEILNEKMGWNLFYLKEIPFRLGLDLEGGSHLVYEAELDDVLESERFSKMQGVRDLIERRINIFGIAEPLVQVKGDRLIVEIAGVMDPQKAIKMIGETPLLEFKEFFFEGDLPEELKDLGVEEQLYELRNTELSGEHLKTASLSFSERTGSIVIELEFTPEGALVFEQVTERNIGKSLAIFLDGKSIIDTTGDGQIDEDDLYAPVVQEKITGGRAIITGETNVERAKQIVNRLKSGALPVPITLISQQTIGPSLGKISLEKSLQAGIFGLLLVVLFMVIAYKLSGVLASLSLVLYALMVLAIFKILGVTVTLSGIAGIILSVGMAIDANILIFARIKEEIKERENLKESIQEGFKRAWPSIRDGNFTTLIVAFILFSFGTSFVKGFALTLIIGILVSLFSAMVITKIFLESLEETKLSQIKKLWF